jgi:FSR family fosmidomycin resistance protein-like MFS transporter
VVQPAFGHWVDRKSRPWLMPVGLAMAGTGLALAGWMPTYVLVLSVLALAGMGVAAFHPSAAQALHAAAGEKRATAMSFFSVGGNAGFALGPLLATGALLAAGLHGSALLVIPGWLMAGLLAANLGLFPVTCSPAREGAERAAAASQNSWGGFAALGAVIFSRSVAFVALNAFLVTYWIGPLGQTRATGAAALSLLLAAGIVGTLVGGWMADRHGRKIAIASGLTLAGLLMLALVLVQRADVAMALLVPLGLGLFAPTSVMVTLGQEYLPERVGLASGVTLGLAVTVGGLAAPVLGWIVDRHGFPAMFTSAAVLSLAAGLGAGLLPRPKQSSPATSSEREGNLRASWEGSVDVGR